MLQYLIGIRCEDKSVWERRTPLIPEDMAQIMKLNPDIGFIVQPSAKRIFSDSEYQKAGAIIQQDLSKCNLILAIKQIPVQKLIPSKTYMFFSHTIKAQPHNMPALDAMIDRKIRLIDYQKISDSQNRRLIAFGKHAGIAGAVDFLKGIGQYIMQMGISTPLLYCNCSYKYFNLEECYGQLKKIGEEIVKKQIPKELRPMIFGITGRGRTAQGCLEVLKNLPITEVSPQEIKGLCQDPQNPNHAKTIYVVNLNTEDVIVPLDPQQKYEKEDYYKNPQKYKNIFHQKYLPYITALFHCIFWEGNSPRYIENSHLNELARKKKLKLLGICDVSCDINGSIECLKHYTNPEKPFFYFDSLNQCQSDDPNYRESKILYLAIDFLPAQIATDASIHFSKILKKWIGDVARLNIETPFNELEIIPELKKAIITSNGSITRDYEYILKLREANKHKIMENSILKKESQKKVQNDLTSSILHNNVGILHNIKKTVLNFQNDQ